MPEPVIPEDLGRRPISEERPSGADIRMTDDYQTIQTEIDKLSAMRGPGDGVNWKLVFDLSRAILTERAKDLTVACYMALAATEIGPIAILAQAADFLADLLDNFWPNLYPALNRLRARNNTLDWWKEKTLLLLTLRAEPVAASVSELMTESLTRLDKVMGQRDLPSLNKLIAQVKSLPIAPDSTPSQAETGAMAEPGHRAGQESGPSSEPAQAAHVPQAAPQPAGEGPAPPQDLAAAKDSLLSALNDYLRLAGQNNLSDPRYWKISRLRLWLNVDSPPRAEGLATMIPGPPLETLASARTLLTADPARALSAAEEQIRISIFWLDPHKLSYEALKALGYPEAADTVLLELQAALCRWPLWPKLLFQDSAPMASPETRSWLKESLPGAAGPAPGKYEAHGGSPQADSSEEPSLALVKMGRDRPRDGRGLLCRRITEAGLWLKLGNNTLARGLADFLTEEITRRDLAHWEPDLAVEGLRAAHEIYLAAGSPYRDQARAVSIDLALLDPQSALELRSISEEI